MNPWIKAALLVLLSILTAEAYAGAYKCTNPSGEIAYQVAQCPNGSFQVTLDTVQDFSGPLETWQRLGDALSRGDKRAALNELTGDLAERFAPLFDSLLSETHSFDVASLGTVSAGTIIGDSLVEMVVIRKTPNGNEGFPVSMLRSRNGKWLIGEM